jgi:hypothetical protein
MYHAIGTLIPLALAVAFSPFPIIATILMLLSSRARPGAVLFMGGWIIGVAVAATIFTVVADYLPQAEDDAGSPITAALRLALGIALLVLAVMKLVRAIRSTSEEQLPRWIASLSSASPARSVVLGLTLGGVNPKNLLLAVAAGLTIGTESLSIGAQIACIAIYTVLASITVIVPVLACLIAGDRMRAPLTTLQRWLELNNSTIMGVLLAILGLLLIGTGVAGF